MTRAATMTAGAAKGGAGQAGAPSRRRWLALAVGIATALAGGPAPAADGFQTWLAGVRREAREAGISPSTLDTAFRGIKPLPTVLKLDRRQPEHTVTLDRYLKNAVNDRRVALGRRLLRQHAGVLDRVGRRYGVPPAVVVALWGIETDFGRQTGGFRVVDALATLAHDGRRAAYFRGELLDALRIIEQRHVTADGLRGSWAGALGQCQFMPSNFLKFAQDFNGDGRRDIWRTEADVFASAANYLANHGWTPSQTWGREVDRPSGLDRRLVGLEVRKPLPEWRRLGLRRVGGDELAGAAGIEASLIQPDGANGRAFLVQDNFRTVMRWNRSTYFATAVGILADRIGGTEDLR